MKKTDLLSLCIMVSTAVFVFAGCKSEKEGNMTATKEQQAAAEKAAAIEVSSPAFTNGSPIPKDCTADGKDMSPPLEWKGAPDGTKSLAIICDDPDAPRGVFVHWIIFNIDPKKKGLPEAIPASEVLEGGMKQGTNSMDKVGYKGPSPPKGPAHRYFFKVYALDKVLDLAQGARKTQLTDAMQGHILAPGQVMGTYKR
jgi:Raf kinase inhibitor-like YbhB/YbcL family protein